MSFQMNVVKIFMPYPSILHVSIIYATYEKCAFVKGVCILFSEPAHKARLRSSTSPIASIAVREKKQKLGLALVTSPIPRQLKSPGSISLSYRQFLVLVWEAGARRRKWF